MGTGRRWGEQSLFPWRRPRVLIVLAHPLDVSVSLRENVSGWSPDNSGQKWNIQFMMVPVIPKLIKGDLFD
jgi:hypothetical protein